MYFTFKLKEFVRFSFLSKTVATCIKAVNQEVSQGPLQSSVNPLTRRLHVFLLLS